jgi:hypothetical protein
VDTLKDSYKSDSEKKPIKHRCPTEELEKDLDNHRWRLNPKYKPEYLNVQKKIKVSYDGKQFLIRFPNEISSFYGLKKGDEVEVFLKVDEEHFAEAREIPLLIKIKD